jgi:hypothetical protein
MQNPQAFFALLECETVSDMSQGYSINVLHFLLLTLFNDASKLHGLSRVEWGGCELRFGNHVKAVVTYFKIFQHFWETKWSHTTSVSRSGVGAKNRTQNLSIKQYYFYCLHPAACITIGTVQPFNRQTQQLLLINLRSKLHVSTLKGSFWGVR